jgi:hypothetical protein
VGLGHRDFQVSCRFSSAARHRGSNTTQSQSQRQTGGAQLYGPALQREWCHDPDTSKVSRSSGVIVRFNGVGRPEAVGGIADRLIAVASWIQKGADNSDQQTDNRRRDDPINV